MGNEALGIYFCGPLKCWGQKSFETSEYFKLLKKSFPVQVVDAQKAAYFFVNETLESRADFFRKRHGSMVSILIAREALSPDFNLFDFAIGFDPILYHDRYLRFVPGYRFKEYLEIKPFNEVEFEKRKFCDFIYSNRFANPQRDKVKLFIESISPVESHGNHLTNVYDDIDALTNDFGWKKAKIEIQSRYRFSIAAENAFHLGYTSEKIFTAFAAGSIPIYWGNPLINLDVNPSRIINLHDFDSESEFTSYVNEINSDSKLFKQIVEEPWFTEVQKNDILEYEERLDNFLQNVFSSRYPQRKGVGTFNSIYVEVIQSGFNFGRFVVILKTLKNFRVLFFKIKSRIKNNRARKRSAF